METLRTRQITRDMLRATRDLQEKKISGLGAASERSRSSITAAQSALARLHAANRDLRDEAEAHGAALEAVQAATARREAAAEAAARERRHAVAVLRAAARCAPKDELLEGLFRPPPAGAGAALVAAAVVADNASLASAAARAAGRERVPTALVADGGEEDDDECLWMWSSLPQPRQQPVKEPTGTGGRSRGSGRRRQRAR